MRSKQMVFSVVVFFLAPVEHCLSQAQRPQGNVIHVEIVGLRNNNGQASCALYASADGFPKKSPKANRTLYVVDLG
jgi:uncharacterized protein (DUF2141 family)